MFRRSLDQKLRLRNFDANEKIETSAVVKSRKGLTGAKGGRSICYQWNEKRPVFEGRPMQFRA